MVSNVAEVENMFRDIVEPSVRVGSRRSVVVPLSIAAHVFLVVVLLITSLMAPGILPMPVATLVAFVSRDVVLPPSPPPAPRQASNVNKRAPNLDSEAAPLEAQSTIAPETVFDSTPALVGVVEGAGNLPAGIIEGLAPALPPSPRVPEPVVPVRVGGNIRPPTKIKDVRPIYPAIAQTARVEGVVIIEATIGPTGRVLDAQLLRSIPLLDAAALEAVRQWEFTPTLLNGSPTPVLMTVTVHFTLR
jgi:protein TonB